MEELVAAYVYYITELSERKISEDQDSVFPDITRKTLRKWVKYVERFDAR